MLKVSSDDKSGIREFMSTGDNFFLVKEKHEMVRAIQIISLAILLTQLTGCEKLCEGNSSSSFCKGMKEGKVESAVYLVKSKLNPPVKIGDGLTMNDIIHDEKKDHAIFIYSVTPNYISKMGGIDAFIIDANKGIVDLTCTRRSDYGFFVTQGIKAIHRFMNSDRLILEVLVDQETCNSK